MKMYLFHVINNLGVFVYAVCAKSFEDAIFSTKCMAGEKAEIMEISKSEAEELINKDRMPIYFA